MQEQNERSLLGPSHPPRRPLAVTVRDGPRRVTEIASLIDEGIIRPVVDRLPLRIDQGGNMAGIHR